MFSDMHQLANLSIFRDLFQGLRVTISSPSFYPCILAGKLPPSGEGLRYDFLINLRKLTVILRRLTVILRTGTEDSSNRHRNFTERAPKIHRVGIENSLSRHRSFTERAPKIHRAGIENSLSRHRSFTVIQPLVNRYRTVNRPKDVSCRH